MLTKESKRLLDRALVEIDRATVPEKMHKAEALEFLAEIEEAMRMRAEALREE